jgi:hypothetical protein
MVGGVVPMSEERRMLIVRLLRDTYADFGATLAAEKLLELDQIKVSAETVRRIQIDLGLWRPKKRRAKRVFQLRQRRPRFGELIQIDGSPHDWFEGCGPRCTLIVLIDDATSRLTALHSLRWRIKPEDDPDLALARQDERVLSKSLTLSYGGHEVLREDAGPGTSMRGST